jgi:SAM-dependent methyltransferase
MIRLLALRRCTAPRAAHRAVCTAAGDDRDLAVQQLLIPALRFYNTTIAEHGATARGVSWKNEELQTRRYHVLCQIFEAAPGKAGFSIHDFGCGYGGLFKFLAEYSHLHGGGRYTGIDMCERMVEAARRHVCDPRAQFSHGVAAAAGDEADYTLVSGTYNMHGGVEPAVWEEYAQASIRRLWANTRRGLAFNMLTTAGVPPRDRYADLFYVDEGRWLEFAQGLAPDARLVTAATDPAMPPSDVTFLLVK